MSADRFPPDVEEAIRELSAQPPAPIDRQHVRLPAPPPIDEQKTRLSSQPPPIPPDAIGEHLDTVLFATNPAVAVAIEGGMAAAQQLHALQQRFAELERRVKGLVRDIRALRGHLLLLEPAAVKAPRLKALISASLGVCDRALASVGER